MLTQKIHKKIQLNFYHLNYILVLQNFHHFHKLKVNFLLCHHLLLKTYQQPKRNITLNLNIMDNIPLTKMYILLLHNNIKKP